MSDKPIEMREKKPFPVPLVCPACREPALEFSEHQVRCCSCNHVYGMENGFPNLIIGARFEDQSDDECLCYEELSNEYTTRHFWIPLFRRLWPVPSRPLRLLAVGCGVGLEVDLLHEAGFQVVGIDIGNRTRIWPTRRSRDWLLLANGMHMPFPDESFDGVFCGCVFPHVGVVGDSFEVTDHYYQNRLTLASEMTRVLRKDGHLIASSPNRRFPFDIFHGRQAGSYKPHINWPWNHFLLSFGDYRKLFLEASCKSIEPIPPKGYWGFVRSRNSLKGRLLGLPARFLLWLSTMRLFRTSPLAPWLVVDARK